MDRIGRSESTLIRPSLPERYPKPEIVRRWFSNVTMSKYPAGSGAGDGRDAVAIAGGRIRGDDPMGHTSRPLRTAYASTFSGAASAKLPTHQTCSLGVA